MIPKRPHRRRQGARRLPRRGAASAGRGPLPGPAGRLVDAGVRGFVVSLLWSFMNPATSERIRELIEREYNETYLGSMPVFLSSQVSPRKLEYTRTTMTILNAYLHQSMYEELIGIGQELRRGGYRNPMMMVHNTGGMASVFRSAAVHTYNGGPVAGLMGSSTLGRPMATTTWSSPTWAGPASTSPWWSRAAPASTSSPPPSTAGRSTPRSWIPGRSGPGGGSVARVDPLLGNRLEVGPESAGSMPGPAAYDQGGREPTVTDADLVLGYLSPRAFTAASSSSTSAAPSGRSVSGSRAAGDRCARGRGADQAGDRRPDGSGDLQGDRAQGL